MGPLSAMCVVGSAVLAGLGFAGPSRPILLGFGSARADRSASSGHGPRELIVSALARVGRASAVRRIGGSARMARRVELAGATMSVDAVVGLGVANGAALVVLGL